MMKSFSTAADLENYVDSMLGNGGCLTDDEIDIAKSYIARQIHDIPGFEWGFDISGILEDIDDNQWNKWIEESLNK
jgi:hypothetical protein